MHSNIICAFGAIDLAAIYRVEWDCFVEALRMRCGRISKVVCPSLEPCTYTCLSQRRFCGLALILNIVHYMYCTAKLLGASIALLLLQSCFSNLAAAAVAIAVVAAGRAQRPPTARRPPSAQACPPGVAVTPLAAATLTGPG